MNFLYEKAVLSANKFDRTAELSAILGMENNQDFDQVGSRIQPKACDRLKTIVCTSGDTRSDFIPSEVQSWDHAMSNELAHWDSNGTATTGEYYVWSTGFDQRWPPEAKRPFQRSQRSRLCYMHAPILLISYIRRSRCQKDVRMINMIEWMRTSFSSRLLHRHIFENLGGDSQDILQKLLGGPGPRRTVPKQWCEIDQDVFRLYGPALVCRFGVYSGFKASDLKYVFSDEDAPLKTEEPRGKILFCASSATCDFSNTFEHLVFNLRQKHFVCLSIHSLWVHVCQDSIPCFSWACTRLQTVRAGRFCFRTGGHRSSLSSVVKDI